MVLSGHIERERAYVSPCCWGWKAPKAPRQVVRGTIPL